MLLHAPAGLAQTIGTTTGAAEGRVLDTTGAVLAGVRHASHGQGIGRLLLDAVADLASADSRSSGVSLTTETAENVKLYEHCGYKVVGEAHVADSFHTWGCFGRAE